MLLGDKVEIKESKGSCWAWVGRYGKIIEVDKYCYTVAADNGETIRDVREHFRPLN